MMKQGKWLHFRGLTALVSKVKVLALGGAKPRFNLNRLFRKCLKLITSAVSYVWLVVLLR